MATTGMWSVKSRLDHLVNYVSNPLKTVTQYVINEEKMMEKRYVTCINCSFDNPKESMEKTKKHYYDEGDILAFHGYQSFEEDEIDGLLYPNLKVESIKQLNLTRFGRMRLDFLKEYDKIIYTNMLTSNTLNEHLQGKSII